MNKEARFEMNEINEIKKIKNIDIFFLSAN